MTMNFPSLFTAVIFLLMKGAMLHKYGRTTTTEIPSITRCDQLPADTVNYTSVVIYSPYFVYRSTNPNHQCATVLGTGLEPNTNTTFMIIKGDTILTKFVLNSDNNQDSFGIDCDNGVNSTYRFIVFNHNSSSQYMCPYTCSGNGTTIDDLRCYGHTSADEADIQQYLETYASNVPGYNKIVNTGVNCTRSKYCPNFDA